MASSASGLMMVPPQHCGLGSQNSSILQLHGAVGGVGVGGGGAGSIAAGSDSTSHHKSMWAINPLYASNSGECFMRLMVHYGSKSVGQQTLFHIKNLRNERLRLRSRVFLSKYGKVNVA